MFAKCRQAQGTTRVLVRRLIAGNTAANGESGTLSRRYMSSERKINANDFPSLFSHIKSEFSGGRGTPFLIGTLGLSSAALIFERWASGDPHGAVNETTNLLTDKLHKLEDEVIEVSAPLVKEVVEKVEEGISEAKSLGEEFVDKVKEVASDTKGSLEEFVEKVEDGVSEAESSVEETAEKVKEGLPDAESSLEEVTEKVKEGASVAENLIEEEAEKFNRGSEAKPNEESVESKQEEATLGADLQQPEESSTGHILGSVEEAVSGAISKTVEVVSDVIEETANLIPGASKLASVFSEKEDTNKDDATGVEDKGDGTPVKATEEVEEDECPFCQFMKGGPCRDEFIAWDACVDAARTEGTEVFDHCLEATVKMKTCMESHREYYAPVLEAESEIAQEAAENAVQGLIKEKEEEKEKEDEKEKEEEKEKEDEKEEEEKVKEKEKEEGKVKEGEKEEEKVNESSETHLSETNAVKGNGEAKETVQDLLEKADAVKPENETSNDGE